MALPPQDFTGYEPGQVPGSYVFQRRGGPPLSFGGPLAERLKQQLDEAQGPDMRVAGPGGGRNVVQPGSPQAAALQASADASRPPPAPRGTPVATAQLRPGSRTVLTPEQAAARQAAEQRAHDVEWAKRDAEAQAKASQAPAEGTPPAIAAPAQPAGPRVLAATKGNGRMYQDPSGGIRVRSGGSPGKSQARLQEEALQGVNTPSRTETIREGAAGGDPDYLDNMANVSIDERLLNMQSADRQAHAASEEALAYGEAAAAAQKRVELENKTAQRMKEETQRAEYEYNSAREEYRNAKIDPRRMFRGPGVFAAIGTTIASAVGAYAATIGRTENFAQKSIQASIDRDIEAQREEIRVKGNAADNALSNLTRKVGDQKAAEAVLRSEQGEYAANLLKARAAASKRPEIIEMAQRWDLAEQKRQIQLRDDYLKARQGKITEKVMGEFAYATKGTGPVDRPATLQELGQYEEYKGKRLGNEKTAQAILNESEGGEVSKEAASNFATTSAVKGDIERVASAHGFTVDPTTGKITKTRPDASFPSRGIGLVPGLPNSPENERLRSDLVKIGRSTAGILNPQGEPSPALVEANTPNASAPDSNIVAQLESAYQMALERERALSAGAKPQELRTLEERRKAVTVQQNQRANAPRANVRAE